MCLYPRRVRNRKYESLEDAQRRSVFSELSTIPPDYFIDIPCGKCWQCRVGYRYDQVLRLRVELQTIPYNTRCYFVTLTFDDASLARYASDYRVPVRRYLDLLRKRYGSFRYWFLSELGDESGRFHFHGILFGLPDIPYKELQSAWKCGISWYGWVTDRTCGYVTKYITKQQFDTRLKYKPLYVRTRSIGSGFDKRGLPLLRQYYTYTNPMDYFKFGVLPNSVVLPGYHRSYVLGRYYREKLFSELARQGSRYLLYQSGTRYFFNGRRFSTREDWLNSIKTFRLSLSESRRERLSQSDMIPRVRLSWHEKFDYIAYLTSLSTPDPFEVPRSVPYEAEMAFMSSSDDCPY